MSVRAASIEAIAMTGPNTATGRVADAVAETPTVVVAVTAAVPGVAAEA